MSLSHRLDGTVEFDRAAYDLTATGEMLGGITRQYVAKMISSGQLRCVRLGRRVLVPADEIARVLGISDRIGGAA